MPATPTRLDRHCSRRRRQRGRWRGSHIAGPLLSRLLLDGLGGLLGAPHIGRRRAARQVLRTGLRPRVEPGSVTSAVSTGGAGSTIGRFGESGGTAFGTGSTSSKLRRRRRVRQHRLEHLGLVDHVGRDLRLRRLGRGQRRRELDHHGGRRGIGGRGRRIAQHPRLPVRHGRRAPPRRRRPRAAPGPAVPGFPKTRRRWQSRGGRRVLEADERDLQVADLAQEVHHFHEVAIGHGAIGAEGRPASPCRPRPARRAACRARSAPPPPRRGRASDRRARSDRPGRGAAGRARRSSSAGRRPRPPWRGALRS